MGGLVEQIVPSACPVQQEMREAIDAETQTITVESRVERVASGEALQDLVSGKTFRTASAAMLDIVSGMGLQRQTDEMLRAATMGRVPETTTTRQVKEISPRGERIQAVADACLRCLGGKRLVTGGRDECPTQHDMNRASYHGKSIFAAPEPQPTPPSVNTTSE